MNYLLKLTLLLVFAIGNFAMQAQENAIDKHFSTYGDDDRFTKISISSKMFNLFTNVDSENPEEDKVIETISKLTGLKMLVGNELENANSLYASAKKNLDGNYEELMTIEDKDHELVFYIEESAGKITELVMISYESNHLVILSLMGDIDLQELSKLSNKMEIEGFEEFKNLEK